MIRPQTLADIINAEGHLPGAKHDQGKNRLGLVLGGFANAVQLVGKVGTFGANKYCSNGWQEVTCGRDRYMDAALRHIFAHLARECNDKESGLPHLAHAVWNLLAVVELETTPSADKT